MNTKRRNTWLSVVVLCLILPACVAPANLPTPTTALPATPELFFTPAPASTPTTAPSQPPTPAPTSAPASTPTPILGDGSGYVPDLFGGCWQFETEDVQFEMELEQRGADLEGTFLLIKLCVVEDVPSACRIREGSIQGTVGAAEVEVRLVIPEYDDEGTALLTVADDGGTLSWAELEYPEAGLADWGTHYLPPTFTLVPCDV
jgi:hypothetical protein